MQALGALCSGLEACKQRGLGFQGSWSQQFKRYLEVHAT